MFVVLVACSICASYGRRVHVIGEHIQDGGENGHSQTAWGSMPSSRALADGWQSQSSMKSLHSRRTLATLLLAFNDVAAGPLAFFPGARGSCFHRRVLHSGARVLPKSPTGLCRRLSVRQAASIRIAMKLDEHSPSVTNSSNSVLNVEENSPPAGANYLLGLPKAVAKFFLMCIKSCMTPKALQACVIGGCADASVQIYSGVSLLQYDFRRTMSLAVWGLCHTGTFRPLVHRQFDRMYGSGSSFRKNVLPKMLTELLAYTTLVYVPVFYMTTGMLQGLGWSGSFAKLCLKYQQTVLAHWSVWLLPLAVYFRYIPGPRRVIFLASVSFVQKCVYSFLGSK